MKMAGVNNLSHLLLFAFNQIRKLFAIEKVMNHMVKF
jgi:hypothetical protein